MIVWINGAVGVGKTSVTRELTSLVSSSHVLEPERVGLRRQRTVGLFRPVDQQAWGSWRRRTVRDAGRLARHGTTVLLPMTMLRTTYLDEMLSGLRALGHPVSHVLLDAPAEVLRSRNGAGGPEPVAIPRRERHIAAYECARAELIARGSTFNTSLHTAYEIAVAIMDMTSATEPAGDDSPPSTLS